MNLPPEEQDLAARLELTAGPLLATRQEITTLCAAARAGKMHGVAVHSARVELAYALLEESGLKVTALIGFPWGAAESDVKRYEAELAVDLGAHELDVVPNHAWLREGEDRRLLRELMEIVEAADERPVKVILESGLLTRDEILRACGLAEEAGAQGVGIGTDFQLAPVTAEEVAALRAAAGEKLLVKASGGIRDAVQAQLLVAAGAGRIGLRASLPPAA